MSHNSTCSLKVSVSWQCPEKIYYSGWLSSPNYFTLAFDLYTLIWPICCCCCFFFNPETILTCSTCTLKYYTFWPKGAEFKQLVILTDQNVDLCKLSSPFISTAKECIETWILVADLSLLTVTDEWLGTCTRGYGLRGGDNKEKIWQLQSAIFDCATGRGASGASLN